MKLRVDPHRPRRRGRLPLAARRAATALAALVVGCAPEPPSRALPPLEGEWEATWMEGYVREDLTITRTEALSEEYALRFVLHSDVGDPIVQERTALLVDGALLLDRAYRVAPDPGAFAALSIEREDDAIALVPYPHRTSLTDAGDVRGAYRRRATE